MHDHQTEDAAALEAWRNDDLEGAERCFIRALELARATSDDQAVESARGSLMFFYASTGAWEKLHPYLVQGLEQLRASRHASAREIADGIWVVGNNLHKMGCLEDARRMFEQALAIQLEELGPSDRAVKRTKESLDALR